MGTGITTGPYAISAGQTLSLNDPATWSSASTNVQLQNNTGFTVFVQSAGAGYNVQPFTSSTIPCAGGQTLVAQVSATANVQVGFLTAVWLLADQTGPIPDGPMTVFPKQVSSITVTQTLYGGGPYYYWGLSGWSGYYSSIGVYYGGTLESPYYMWLVSSSPAGNIGPVYCPPGVNSAIFNFNLSAYTQAYIYYGSATAPIAPALSNYIGPVTAVQST